MTYFTVEKITNQLRNLPDAELLTERDNMADELERNGEAEIRADERRKIIAWCRSSAAESYDDPYAHEGLTMEMAGDFIELAFGLDNDPQRR